MKDRFNIDIQEGDQVIFFDHWYDWSFKNFERGIVVGFTPNFVKVKPIDKDVLIFKEYTLRKPQYLIVDKSDIYKDNWLRLAAELDNYKKNVNKRTQLQIDSNKDNILNDLLEFIDDLKRAIDNNSNNEGLKIILNKNLNVLKNKYNIIPIDEYLGDNKKIFDSKYHEAISILPSESDLDNTIAGIIQEGYVYKSGRVLRIQKVVVYKNNEE